MGSILNDMNDPAKILLIGKSGAGKPGVNHIEGEVVVPGQGNAVIFK